MSSLPSELVGDPLFQLNAILWLTQPLPENAGIVPLLHSRGFTVHAVSPVYAVPPALALLAEEQGVSIQRTASPDVVLADHGKSRFAFVECKKSSFSSDSSTARQARTLLILAGTAAAEVLALEASGHTSILAFLTRESECALLKATLVELAGGLHSAQIKPAAFGLLGLASDEKAIYISPDSSTGAFFQLESGPTTFIPLDADTDPRPLYFFPYDPSIAQTDEESAYCKRVLYERIHVAVLRSVGRAGPKATVTVNAEGLLNEATFKFYALMQTASSRDCMRRLCKYLMNKLTDVVSREVPGGMTSDPRHGWTISWPDPECRERVHTALLRFSCETLELRVEPPADLFDYAEGSIQTGDQY